MNYEPLVSCYNFTGIPCCCVVGVIRRKKAKGDDEEMREPKSTNECIYFTRRNDADGKIKCWVFKEKCPECGKGLIQKPRDPKTGKPKIRSTEYVCAECGYAVEKKQYEDSLMANIQYECGCGHKGELEIPFKRKNIQRVNEETGKKKSVPALVFECESCGKKHAVTKKMK